MNKFELKKKDVNSNFVNVIKLGYCSLDILHYLEPIGFTCGIYGWNSDIYYVNSSTAISTGYRQFGNIEPSRELVEKYNDKFNHFRKMNDFETWHNNLDSFLEDFAKEAIEESKH